MRVHAAWWVCGLLCLPPAALAGCRAGDPQGRFIGSARVDPRDPLPLELELRCEAGQYRGELIAQGERLALRFGSFDLGELHLRFSGASQTTLEAHPTGDRLEGSFRRAGAAGPLTLTAVGAKSRAPAVAEVVAPQRPSPEVEPAAALAPPTLQLTADQWREDLRFVAAELPRRFPASDRPRVEARVSAAIAGLERRLAWTDGDHVYLALERLASELGAPSALERPADEARLPLELREIDGAFRVVAATAGNDRALGAQLVAIDGVPLAKVERRLLPFCAGRPLTALLVRGLFLHGAGVARARDSVRYTLRDPTGRFTVDLRALAPDESPVWHSVASSVPLFRQRPDEPFWCDELPELSVLYCRVRDRRGISESAAAMRALLDRRRPEVLVIDLRLDRAVDPRPAVRELVEPVRKRPWLDHGGGLFVLIGPETSAAGAALAARFRARTRAKLVGEACSVSPAALETATLVLPRSRLVFRYPAGQASAGTVLRLRPQVEVRPKWADIAAGRDPVLDWVLRHARLH